MTPEQIAPAWNAWWSSVSTGANDKHMQTAFEAGYLAALKAQQPREDVVERVATVLAPFVCRPVHNGDCDDIAAGQSHARYVARAAIAAMQEGRA